MLLISVGRYSMALDDANRAIELDRPCEELVSQALQQGLPEGVEIVETYDRSALIDRAVDTLSAKLLDTQLAKQKAEETEARRSLVGSGDRSERIRTYNFPQGRMTDHRINLTVYKLDEFMSGNLDLAIEPLVHEYQADQLTALNEPGN